MSKFTLINKDYKILIVGLGLLGGSYAQGLTDVGFNVGAIDVNEESINYALKGTQYDPKLNEDMLNAAASKLAKVKQKY